VLRGFFGAAELEALQPRAPPPADAAAARQHDALVGADVRPEHRVRLWQARVVLQRFKKEVARPGAAADRGERDASAVIEAM
jgi:hypothetical protein